MMAHRVLHRRFLRAAAAVLIAGSIAAPGLASAQQEAPTAETEIIVNVESVGTFDVAFVSQNVAFTQDGADPVLSASNATPHVTAPFSFTIADTRNPPTGYTIVLSTDGLVSDSGATIPADALTVDAVSGIPASATSPLTANMPLAASVTVMTIPDGAEAVNATIDFTLGTTLPATTTAGTYSGTFTLTVQPLDAQP